MIQLDALSSDSDEEIWKWTTYNQICKLSELENELNFMEVKNEGKTQQRFKKIWLEECKENCQKWVQFVLDNWKWTYKNRITFLWLLLLFIDIESYRFSIFFLLLTWGGSWTEDIYKRTKEHISKYWKLDEKFFVKLVDFYSKNIVMWYCEQQGIYLAAKEFWLEKEFFELKAKHTNNIIPNF